MNRRQWGGWLLALAICFVPAGQTWAQPELEQPLVGLQGILPDLVPDDLVEEQFLVLGETWEEWSSQVAELLRQLYEPEEPLSIAEQRQVLAQLRSRLRVMERAIADPAYQAIFSELISLHGRIVRRVDLAEAVLDTLEADPTTPHVAELASARHEARQALGRLEGYLQTVRNGAAWLPWVRAQELNQALQDDAPPEQMLAVAADVRDRLRAREGQDPQQQEFLSRPAFVDLERALDRLVAVAGRPTGPEREQALRDVLAQLAEEIERYEATNLGEAVENMRAALRELRGLAPDGGRRIESVLRAYYFNYNLQILLSEDFLARMVSDERCEYRPVHDYMMGARVTGHQTTQSTVGFDLKPSDDGARFQLILQGQVNASTRADARQATIFNQGFHRFYATKEGLFDGVYFHFQPAHVNVNPNTQILGASTQFDGWPILGKLARGMAIRQARRRLPEANATTAGRMIAEIGREFDRETREQFDDTTRELQTGMLQRLSDQDLYARVTRIRSSDKFMRMSYLVADGPEPGGGVAPVPLAPGPGITMHIHESLLNNAANRLGWAGRTMTDQEVREELDQFLSDLFGREIRVAGEEEPAEVGPNIYIFEPTDPLRFQIDNGTVFMIMRTAFRDERRDDDIAPQIVTIPLTPTVVEEGIHISRGTVRVAPVTRPENLPRQIAQAGVIRTKIEQEFQDRTERRRLRFERRDREDVIAYINRIVAVDGWLSMWAE